MESRKCAAHKTNGEPCPNWAMHGTTVCHAHGGRASQVRRAAEGRQQVEQVRQAADRLGVPREIEPGQGLLDLVWEAAGNVEYYRQQVAALPTHPEPDTLTVDADGPHWTRGDPGIYGRTYHQSGIPTGEAKRHILVQMYDDERKHLLDCIKAALAADIDKRQIDLAEIQARNLFASVAAAMTAAALTPAQAEAFKRVLTATLKGTQPAAIAS